MYNIKCISEQLQYLTTLARWQTEYNFWMKSLGRSVVAKNILLEQHVNPREISSPVSVSDELLFNPVFLLNEAV